MLSVNFRSIWPSTIYIILSGVFLLTLPTKIAVIVCVLLPLSIFSFYYFLQNTKHLILLYIFSIPFVQQLNAYPIPLGDFLITPHMIIQSFLSIVVLSNFLAFYNSDNNYSLNTLDKLLLVMCIFSLTSLILPYSLPVNHTKRWLYFYTGIIEPITFYFIILFALKKNLLTVSEILSALALSIIPSFLVALLEIRNFDFNLIKIYFARYRIGFGFRNVNMFGIYSSLILPVIFFKVTDTDKSNLFFRLSLVLVIVLSVLTMNRGTFLILIIQFSVLYLNKVNRKSINLIVFVLVIVLAINNELVFFYLKRFFSGSGSEGVSAMLDKSAQYRLDAWMVALKALVLYPLGAGSGSFQFLWEKYGSDPTFYLGSPHSIFLNVGVDYGIITMIIFISILIYSLKLLFKNRQHNVMNQYFFISILGYMVYSSLTNGELSHLTANMWPSNGYSLVLMTILSIISFEKAKAHAHIEK